MENPLHINRTVCLSQQLFMPMNARITVASAISFTIRSKRKKNSTFLQAVWLWFSCSTLSKCTANINVCTLNCFIDALKSKSIEFRQQEENGRCLFLYGNFSFRLCLCVRPIVSVCQCFFFLSLEKKTTTTTTGTESEQKLPRLHRMSCLKKTIQLTGDRKKPFSIRLSCTGLFRRCRQQIAFIKFNAFLRCAKSQLFQSFPCRKSRANVGIYRRFI